MGCVYEWDDQWDLRILAIVLCIGEYSQLGIPKSGL